MKAKRSKFCLMVAPRPRRILAGNYTNSCNFTTAPYGIQRTMQTKVETVKVNLEERSYNIKISSGNLDTIGSRLHEIYGPGTCFVVTDENVAEPYARPAVESLQNAGFDVALTAIPSGEEQKTLQTAEKLYGEF